MEHGKRVITADPKKDERDLTLQINLTALIKIHSLQGMTAFVMSWIKEYLNKDKVSAQYSLQDYLYFL